MLQTIESTCRQVRFRFSSRHVVCFNRQPIRQTASKLKPQAWISKVFRSTYFYPLCVSISDNSTFLPIAIVPMLQCHFPAFSVRRRCSLLATD